MLKLDGADSGVDLDRGVEAGVVRAGQVVEELGGPGAAVAAVGREPLVDDEGGADRDGDQHVLLPHEVDVVVVLYAIKAFTVGNLILAEQDLVRAFERWRHDETSALVVERGKNCRSRGYFFDGGQLRVVLIGANDVDDRRWLGDGVGLGLRLGAGRFGWRGSLRGRLVGLGRGGGRCSLEEVSGGGLAGGSRGGGTIWLCGESGGGGENGLGAGLGGCAAGVGMLGGDPGVDAVDGDGIGRVFGAATSVMGLGLWLGFRLSFCVGRSGGRRAVGLGLLVRLSLRLEFRLLLGRRLVLTGVQGERRKGQSCERQNGCNGGVCAHRHLGGAETPEQDQL